MSGHRRIALSVPSKFKYRLKEEQLIQLLQQQDENAYRQLVEQCRTVVFNVILNMLQDTAEAEDAAQEVFIQVFESIGRFKKDSSLNTWIYRIAVRKALDKLRQRKSRKGLLRWMPWWMPEEDKPVEDRFYHPGIRLEHQEKAADLYRAISKLPEKQKVAFTLIKIEKMNYQQTSEIMGQGIKAIESLVSRAKINLQKELQHYQNQ